MLNCYASRDSDEVMLSLMVKSMCFVLIWISPEIDRPNALVLLISEENAGLVNSVARYEQVVELSEVVDHLCIVACIQWAAEAQ